MNSAESKRLTETVSSAGSMVLFLMFAVFSLIIITVAASAYKRISDNYDDTFNSAAAVRYVTNKLRACESAEIFEDGSIVLADQGFMTVIYERDDVLYERLFAVGQEAAAEGGEAVFGVRNYSVKNLGDGLISISALGGGGDVFTAYCRIGDGGEAGEYEKSH
ncbi:MAG: DUF4860 domain-containing protein [Oscillospiraceae bacterium]|nr:DUF4860 domain-containing protein [Oscillospiraceae bacterium]